MPKLSRRAVMQGAAMLPATAIPAAAVGASPDWKEEDRAMMADLDMVINRAQAAKELLAKAAEAESQEQRAGYLCDLRSTTQAMEVSAIFVGMNTQTLGHHAQRMEPLINALRDHMRHTKNMVLQIVWHRPKSEPPLVLSSFQQMIDTQNRAMVYAEGLDLVSSADLNLGGVPGPAAHGVS